MRKFAKSQVVNVVIADSSNSKLCEFVGKIIQVHVGDLADFEYTVEPLKVINDDMGFLTGCGDQVLIQECEISYEEPSNLLKGIL